MRIATWNVERLKHFDQINTMQSLCRDVAADILVLTETDSRIHPDYKYCVETPKAKDVIPGLYKDTENRVSIYTDYPIIRQYDTYDPYTAICAEIETDKGNLLVYGTIMGIFGNREKSYKSDLEMQMKDIRCLSENGSICIIGDYNCSFSDNYYFTNYGRDLVTGTFYDIGISILTESQPECIDHIAVSDVFVEGVDVEITEWNLDKSLSDHKGIVVDLK